MIRVENAGFSYEKNGKLLFKGLSFDVEKGETLAILGPNGIGKTTLLRCLMGFLKLREGDVFIDGTSTKEMDEKTFWKQISYVPQAKKLVFGYTAVTMVVMGLSQEIGLGQTPKKEYYDEAYRLLESLGLKRIADQSCNTLSGGELQMVLIARALIKKPQLLIMDEPESNLDLKNQIIVLNTIEKLTGEGNIAVIINTHYPDHALRVAQKTLMLGPDSYLFGETEKVVSKDNIRKFFEINVQILSYERSGKTYGGIVPIDIL